jgi:hypothetical protein
MASRPSQSRAIAASTLAAGRETFAPRRLLFSPWLTQPTDTWRWAATGPRAVLRGCRAVVGAAERVPDLLGRVSNVIGAVELLVLRIDDVRVRANGVLEQIATACGEADATVDGVLQIEKRVNTLIDRCEPIVDAVAELDPSTVNALQALVIELQPLLVELHDAVPDVRDILPVVRRLEPVMVDVETRIAGLPGAGRLRERGERVIQSAGSDNTVPDNTVPDNTVPSDH